MEITHIALSGYDDMVRAIYMSNKKYNDELEMKITRGEYLRRLSPEKRKKLGLLTNDNEIYNEYRKMIDIAFNIACGTLYNKTDEKGAITPDQIQLCHSTIGRFLDISCTVNGLHRGATDDFDAHARRLDSRIVRRSTRTNSPDEIVLSDWYKDKVIPFGDLDGCTVTEVTNITENTDCEIRLPPTIIVNNKVYRKSRFGYVADEFKDNYDVLRGLTPLGMSNLFTFKCNITEWAHITKLREPGTHAAPELQQMIQMINQAIEQMEPRLDHDFWMYCIQ